MQPHLIKKDRNLLTCIWEVQRRPRGPIFRPVSHGISSASTGKY